MLEGMSSARQKTLLIIALVSAVLAGLAGPAVAWGLVLLPAYSSALLIVSRLKEVRPSRPFVRWGAALSLVAGVIFSTSMLVSIELATTPREAWQIGGAGISHTTYRTRSPHYPNAPQLTIRWQPCPCPFGGSFISLVHDFINNMTYLTSGRAAFVAYWSPWQEAIVCQDIVHIGSS